MAFTEAQRVSIFRWLGATRLYKSFDPRIETAITAVQSQADGGSQIDSSTETEILGFLTQLGNIEMQWQAYYVQMQVGKADETTIDPLRGIAGLIKIGRMYVASICAALGLEGPRRDIFSGFAPAPAGASATSHSNLP